MKKCKKLIPVEEIVITATTEEVVVAAEEVAVEVTGDEPI